MRGAAKEERILIVPRDSLFAGMGVEGFLPHREGLPFLTTIAHHQELTRREEAEDDPGKKQIIPYVMIIRGASPEPDFLLFQRQGKSGEPRLRTLYSIGIGGHVSEIDREGDLSLAVTSGDKSSPSLSGGKGKNERLGVSPQVAGLFLASAEGDLKAVLRGLCRELEEEVVLPEGGYLEFLGYLNDEGNEVGKVHFGLVFTLTIPSPEVSLRKEEGLQGKLVPRSSLADSYPMMETWSQILFRGVVKRGDRA